MFESTIQASIQTISRGNNFLPPDLDTAILYTVSYADIFEYPLTLEEIHRYLIGFETTLDMVENKFKESHLLKKKLSRVERFISLTGREHTALIRQRRSDLAIGLWSQAIRFGWLIANLPYIRMVAVTGALAADNPKSDSDLDFLVVTSTGRLWSCRAMIIGFSKLAPLLGVRATICPNYLITEQAMLFKERNLYSAYEMARMVPIVGMNVYNELRQLNPWVKNFLPNAEGPPREYKDGKPIIRPLQTAGEAVINLPPGNWLEKWEMNRKIRKFNQYEMDSEEASFSENWCKGHFNNHGIRITSAFLDRINTINL